MTDPHPTRVGVDIGGTHIRVSLYQSNKERIRREECLSDAYPEKRLRTLLRHWGIEKADRLVVGARGIWTNTEHKALTRRLRGLGRRIHIFSDLELAWRAALNGPGIVVIAGTGSSAYAGRHKGRHVRAGGLGPLMGDEGSAFWMGKSWLKKASEVRIRHYVARTDSVAAIAKLARTVLQRANAGDPSARRIRESAAAHLAQLAENAGAHLRGRVPLSWHGGLFKDAGFLKSFLRRTHKRFVPQPPLFDPDMYAATTDAI